MVCLGNVMLAGAACELPKGYILTYAPVDLLKAMGVHYYRCICGRIKGGKKHGKLVFRNAIMKEDFDRVLYVMTIKKELQIREKIKRSKA